MLVLFQKVFDADGEATVFLSNEQSLALIEEIKKQDMIYNDWVWAGIDSPEGVSNDVEPVITLSAFPGAVFSHDELLDMGAELREKVLGWVGHVEYIRGIRKQAQEFGAILATELSD